MVIWKIAEEDLSTAFYRDEQIDFELMLREQFQLLLPMKPLCRTDCRGLCLACGTNLNSEQCSCDTSWHDPRLAALETLLADPSKGLESRWRIQSDVTQNRGPGSDAHTMR